MTEVEFHARHLDFLKNLNPDHDRQGPVGKKLHPYAKRVQADISQALSHYIDLSTGCIARSELQRACGDPRLTTIDNCIAIFAWGGMRTHHAKMALKTQSLWLPIVDQIRSGALGRREAYFALKKIRQENNLRGMGPAYFTKLIYFFGWAASAFSKPQHQGFIMDQWTARSANLLLNNPHFVKLTKLKSVADNNTDSDYENFCCFIEHLARRLNIEPEAAEIRIFSKGGRAKGEWRQYLLNNEP